MKKLALFILCIVLVLSVVLPVSALRVVSVKSISLDKSTISLDVGKTHNITVTFTPANTTQKLLAFSTSDKNVALVDSTGKITAIKGGNAVVTVASTSNKKAMAKVDVTVTQQPPVKLSFCLSQTGWGGEAVDPELMKEVQKVIEQKTNTVLDVIAPPHSSYNDKLNVMLASGQIPDIFAIRKAMDNVQIMAARGYTMPLDTAIKKFPEITGQVGKRYLDYMRVEGKLMAVPMYVPLSKVIWMRKGTLDLYGVKLSETPTPDEFYNEMKKIDSKRFIPFTFPKFLDNLPFFFNPFGAYYGIGINNAGLFYDGFNTPMAKEALAYCAKLYKDKIWDQEFVTNENASMREKLFSGKAISALDYYNRYIYYSVESYRVNKPSAFVPVYELKGPKGYYGNLNEAIQDALAISSKSKNVEKALEVIKYYVYTEEGVKLRNLGVEGKHYTIENGTIQAIDRAKNSGYKSDVNGFFLYFPKISDYGFKWDPITEKLMPEQIKVNAEANKHLGPRYIVPGGKSDLYDKNQPAYVKKIQEISAKIITGHISIDAGYAEHEAFWRNIKGDDMLAELNK